MKLKQKVLIKSTQQQGTITAIENDMISVYIPKKGTFKYSVSNLEVIDRIPVSDCIDNTH